MPTNDKFANATKIIGLAGRAIINNVGATTEAGESIIGDGYTVWYSYTPTLNGTLSVTTKYTPLPDWDSIIAIYTGATLGTLVNQASDDDSALQAGATQPDGFGTSLASLSVEAGVKYSIQIGAYDSDDTTRARSDAILAWELIPSSNISVTPKVQNTLFYQRFTASTG